MFLGYTTLVTGYRLICEEVKIRNLILSFFGFSSSQFSSFTHLFVNVSAEIWHWLCVFVLAWLLWHHKLHRFYRLPFLRWVSCISTSMLRSRVDRLQPDWRRELGMILAAVCFNWWSLVQSCRLSFANTRCLSSSKSRAALTCWCSW